MGREHQRQCVHCDQGFTPDARNARHQRYCAAAPCKAASKRASQAKWLAKPENWDYHRGPQAVARVQAWRQAHPGYSRRPAGGLAGTPIQQTLPFDPVPAAPTLTEVLAAPQISCNAPGPVAAAPLQDLLNAQPIVLVGLIAHLWGSALQEAMPHPALPLLCRTGNYAARGLADRRHAGFLRNPVRHSSARYRFLRN